MMNQVPATWAKYTQNARPGWTWQPTIRPRFRPFDSFVSQCILCMSGTGMLVLLTMLVAR